MSKVERIGGLTDNQKNVLKATIKLWRSRPNDEIRPEMVSKETRIPSATVGAALRSLENYGYVKLIIHSARQIEVVPLCNSLGHDIHQPAPEENLIKFPSSILTGVSQ